MPNLTNSFCRYVLTSAILLCSVLMGGCKRNDGTSTASPSLVMAEDTSAVEQRTMAFCGHCHAMPPPQSFPKDAWYDEVERGYEFYFKTGRTDLDPPPLIQAVNYFRERAPATLQLPTVQQNPHPFGRRFVPKTIDKVEFPTKPPAVTHICIQRFLERPSSVFFCDARSGDIRSFWDPANRPSANSLAQLRNPSHIEPTDLDNNGVVDFIVSELGSIYPADHDQGRITWLRSEDGRTNWSPITLKEGLGRVADARPGDFDGDGLVDLMAAVFGWHSSGEILWLKNLGMKEGRPEFQSEKIDSRHGAIHVLPCDLNADKQLDFIALISQEYEVVEAFLNESDGKFARRTVFAAADPGYGSSGIELVDLDRDGDLDVLYTNGDSFDSKYLKPTHGVHWLENEGTFPFRDRPLAQMPGAYRALAADFDKDQDLDVAVSAFVPRSQISNAAVEKMVSLLVLEHIENNSFHIHVIEQGTPKHAALGIVDADGDGDEDIVAGHYAGDTLQDQTRLTLWVNEPQSGEQR